MTTNVTLHAGHDVAYFTRGQDAGGCAGAMSYYTAAGEPPGQWAGTAARKSLGLTGQVDAGVLDRLFMKGIGPDGEILAAKRQRKDAAEREEAAVAAYRAAHPYAICGRDRRGPRRRARQGPAHRALLRPDRQRGQERVRAARLLPDRRPAGPRPRRGRGSRRAGREGAGDRGRADRVGARSGRLAGSACHLHPHRPPLRHHGGVARRRRPGRRVVPASHQPRRRPAAARPRGDLEPGPARRRGRRANGAPWTPGRCTTSGSASPPPPTG